jgi:hypothetical protein
LPDWGDAANWSTGKVPVKLSVHAPGVGGVVKMSTAGAAAFPVLSTANTP